MSRDPDTPAKPYHSHRRADEIHHVDLTARLDAYSKMPRRVIVAFLLIAFAAVTFIFSYAAIGREAAEGCIRDQQTTLILRGILDRSLEANEQLHKQGVRDEVEYKSAKESVKFGLEQLQVPQC
jgi:hypothetical protein